MSTQKNTLKVLEVNRPLKEGEHVVRDIFDKYGHTYDLIIFPPKEDDELVIQVVTYSLKYEDDYRELLNVHIEYDGDDLPPFFDFDIYEIELDIFYDVLDQRFDIETFDLTTIERNPSS